MKTNSGNIWLDESLPLCVIYSPILRLRFRQALSSCIKQINLTCQREVFSSLKEAENHLAIDLESAAIQPPSRTVYVQGCKTKDSMEGSVVILNATGHPSAAIVLLPYDEKSSYTTFSVVMGGLFQLLGLPYFEDSNCALSEANRDTLEKVYK